MQVRVALKTVVWGVCLFPLGLLLYHFQTDNLGANPIEYVTRTLGVWTLRILLATLAMTPLRLLFGISWPLSLRRLLGLFAFFYLCLHFAVWIVIDHFFDWPQMTADVVKRPFITVGVLTLTLLVPLAATSTTRMVKRLGATNWRRLHRLVYVAGVLGVLHFLWLAKVGRVAPFVYAAILVFLLGVRVWDWARRLVKRRRQNVVDAMRIGVMGRRAIIVLTLLSIGLLGWAVWPADGRALRLGASAPEIAGGPWINSPPLTMSGLRGRVVLVEFWTYG